MSEWVRANTDWFRDAKWGVFMHYLPENTGHRALETLTPDAWNRQIDAFDVVGLADQLEEVGAGYFCISIGQNSGYFLSPNATYDSIVGRKPTRLSSRDLIADLAAALKPKGIRMMAYLPSNAPAQDREAVEALKCTPKWDGTWWGICPGDYIAAPGVDDRLTEFQNNWEAVIREWSLRWGGDVHGWWFDGCYFVDKMYRHPDQPNFASFAAAAKAGNPESLVAWNPGVKTPVITLSEYEDYTAGEIAFDFPTRPIWWDPPRDNYRFHAGAQYHILTFLGEWWGQGPLRLDDGFVTGYTKHVNGLEGVITWDAAPTVEGLIQEEFMRQLRVIGSQTRR
jgi:hypothetical protein